MKYLKNYLVLVAIILSLCFIVPTKRTKSVEAFVGTSSAKGMCVIEKESKRIMYSNNPNAKLPMASTTKVVTAITVLQYCNDLEEYIAVDDSAIGIEGTSIYLRAGEEIKVKDLLYGLMLRSGNDAAVALACHVGGDVTQFAEKMNELAKSVGAENSNFTNPHGLHDDNHYTTAYDLSLITAYALNNPIFKEIVSTKNYIIEATNKSDKRYLTNKNKLLSSLDGCCGVKTGFTKKAGRCLVSACERENTTYICVVLNCGPMFEESAKLLNMCHNNYTNEKIIDKNKEILNEYVVDEIQGRLNLYTDEDFYYPIAIGEEDSIHLEYNVQLNDAKVGDNVGEIKVFFNNHLIKTLKLYTMNKIDRLMDSNSLQIKEILWEERTNEN